MSKQKATQSQYIAPDPQTGRTVTTPANIKAPKGNSGNNSTKSK